MNVKQKIADHNAMASMKHLKRNIKDFHKYMFYKYPVWNKEENKLRKDTLRTLEGFIFNIDEFLEKFKNKEIALNEIEVYYKKYEKEYFDFCKENEKLTELLMKKYMKRVW